ncbi:ribonucleoside-diphosphate reductase subunit alpha [Quadrisphaera setariae]|uniref:Ribonucleoside-diphosphate reductase n=1 Tax=Quadrisphaera setariae TaxID=2593304 RepID=A0A5C8Z479_9ACTN|nr:ribonucleoside-diphosphate reductase subunit alpha [Quadrisphaera setariae]TXR52905.1 ribonucleoside-diphosphate reductase subunit alpha [Quadrisphaera setariae]
MTQVADEVLEVTTDGSASGNGETTEAPTAVINRRGEVVPFDASRISVALQKAFLATEGQAAGSSARVRELVDEMTRTVVETLVRRSLAGSGSSGRPVAVEEVQDQVELVLMRSGEHAVARSYILYREEHARARRERDAATPSVESVRQLSVRTTDGTLVPLDRDRVAAVVAEACAGLPTVDPDAVVTEAMRTLYDGVGEVELAQALVLAARTKVEVDPDYTYVSARLLMDMLRTEALSHVLGERTLATAPQMAQLYPRYLKGYVTKGIELGMLDPRLAEFDLDKLGQAIEAGRDGQFTFLGLQTLYDRYFLHEHGVRYELPQAFFLRVAMGLALNEEHKEERAIEFYRLISSFDFMCSTPTLFNAGTTRPQLSSCFLTTVSDDLSGIFQSIKDNAMLAKYSGGLGNDWTPVRGIGAHIKGTNGQSQGVVPFLKIANDTAVAVNQGGKRKGAVCAYLETWHIDVEEFLELRKNTGDERRRTHDMNTANWVPDLFMQRVAAGGTWTLFSPDETPDLHDLYGAAFAERYAEYEAMAERGELRVHRQVNAVDLWRKMLTALFETGHPWITFKDPCNLRSPQQHVGVVHSSNLCTEITLNTNADEVAVCNLGSINLAAHTTADGLDVERLRRTVRTAVRMLDNVIDLNLYTIPQAENANQQHRPVGLGLMGFQDALFALRLPYSSEEAVQFADTSMEQISYAAIEASSDLAAERGSYRSFDGSLWSRGVLPIDSLELLRESRGGDVDLDTSTTLDWAPLREKVQRQGMRNSNVMAIAPTATISNIVGVAQSIEPMYRNLFVKSNMSGDFTVVNASLVRDLAERGLWDEVMVSDLKYFDGSLGAIDRVPADLQALYATAFEVDPSWLLRSAARRQKWIDQAQSLNLYVSSPNGRKLDNLYRTAWQLGLKTTYYLRSSSATHVEKSTLRGTDGKLNAVSAGTPAAAPSAGVPTQGGAAAAAGGVAAAVAASPAAAVSTSPSPLVVLPETAAAEEASRYSAEYAAACSIENGEDCEACQ